ncbi:MAG: hypothetical protein EP344_04805, partial [Bacteroidetes bacterium]
MNSFTLSNRKFMVGRMIAIAAFLLSGLTVFAQVTTSSITGSVTDADGEALVGATIVATHVPSGTRYGTSTNDAGRYIMPAVRVGGPYTIVVTYTGFERQESNNIYLSLGQSFRHDVNMSENAQILDEVAVVAKRDILNTEQAGPSTSISEDEINVLPTVARDLTDFTRLTPQANITGDNVISIAGANNRFNAVYIDGAVNNDVFGLAASGTNGGQTGITPISPDAIEQFQVVVAPYDVKLSGFSGGGINAVTRSGSNEIEGSVYYFMRNEGLAGKRPTNDEKLADFKAQTYGLRLAGPIIKDKAFFFVNAELQKDETPQPFDFANYNGNATQSQLDQISSALQTLGYDPGGYLGKTDKLEGQKILARLDFNLSQNHKLMVRHHYTKGTSTYAQSSSNRLIRYANAGIYFPSVTNSTAVELNSILGEKASNNLIVGYTSVNDDRDPLGSPFPGIEIQDGSGSIQAGSELFSGANGLEQKIFTLTDNFNLYMGKHNITIGTH